MKLLDDFCIAELIAKEDNNYKIKLTLNSDHTIYKAHFPNNPITPGVCLLQIAKEICQKFIYDNKKIIVSKCKNIKFLYPINPLENAEIIYKIKTEQNLDSTSLTIEIIDKKQELIFTKMKISITF